MRIRLLSCLEKCFLDEDILTKPEYTFGTMLKNEAFHFGVCFDQQEICMNRNTYRLNIESPLKPYIHIERIEHLPVQMPTVRPIPDENYLRTAPGLYPDLLLPQENDARLIVTNTLQSLLIEVDPQGQVEAGTYPITLIFSHRNTGEELRKTFTVEIIDALLPPQTLIHTEWFYCDCLQSHYLTQAFDERHWQIIENFMRTAARHGQNMILTPIFTPPLDTAVGRERPTTQLVEVTVDDGYRFDFAKLDRWIDLCDRVGIHYLEIAHFFTQWGAEHAPKIMATVNGEYKQIFGWDTDAAGKEYRKFLQSLIPALLSHLKARGDDDRCWFHISDEPNAAHLASYQAAKDGVRDLLKGYPIIDALSHYEYYEQGLVEHPVPSTTAVEPFLEHQVPDLWVYYCMTQGNKSSNRFLSMPCARTRVLGTQLYKYNIAGFLHWGYNFYYNQFSFASVNPYLWTDNEYFSPAGDSFLVYPAPDGTPYRSLRLIAMQDALQDMRALQLCEQLYGKDHVLSLIEQNIDPITFSDYPHSADWLLSMRERINRAIQHK